MVRCRIAMSVTEFSYYHPRAYRRLLVTACAGMLAVGLGSSLMPHQGRGGGLSFTNLAMAVPTAAESAQPVVVPITQLPGSDGSAKPGTAAPAVSVPAAAALTVNGDVRGLGRIMNASVFGDGQWAALDALWTRESNWNPNSANRHSGACGIPQALPCSKIADHSPTGQISWGLSYIRGRYGTPSSAWTHEKAYGWY